MQWLFFQGNTDELIPERKHSLLNRYLYPLILQQYLLFTVVYNILFSCWIQQVLLVTSARVT